MPKSKIKNSFVKKLNLEYLTLFLILFFSGLFRFIKLGDLLGFWYDQGRDALVIWELIHNGKFFLIGPVTGIEGMFLGPFYYYLLTPFYFIGKGNPVTAATGLVLLTLGAIFLIYLLGKKVFNYKIGLLAAFLYGFSYKNVIFSRWLANPNPLALFAMVVLWFIVDFVSGNKRSLVFAWFFIGLCLQLEAASAVFFIPATIVIMIMNRKKINIKLFFICFLSIFITLLPQIYFNFRHGGILFNAFKKFLVEEKSFKINIFNLAGSRLLLYYDVFGSRLLPNIDGVRIVSLATISAMLFIFRKKIFNPKGLIFLVWLIVPLLGYLFYQGNNGYVWDYYFTGVVPCFTLLFSAGLIYFLNIKVIGKIFLAFFILIFLYDNLSNIKKYLDAGIGINLGSQKKALDYIYKDAKNEPFNVDVYVPPKIFYSYTYLFKWYGNKMYNREPDVNNVKNLYTLFEPNNEWPYLLQIWLERQDGIGKIVKDDYFSGNITVQKRERIKYE